MGFILEVKKAISYLIALLYNQERESWEESRWKQIRKKGNPLSSLGQK